MESYLFSFQMMHKSQFQKIDPYDWFCGHNLLWLDVVSGVVVQVVQVVVVSSLVETVI